MVSFRKVYPRPVWVVMLCTAQPVMYVILKPCCWSSIISVLDGVHTHSRSSAWWMRCSCLFTEYVGRVRKDGGKTTAASTVVPSMFGNSVRISSQTISAYDPALWPRMERTTPICSVCLMLSAMERLWGASSLVKESQALLISYPGWLPMRRGDWAKLQHTLGSVHDLRLYLVTLLYTMNPRPCMQSYWKKS